MKKINEKFINKVIKQGNSLCVRIPFKVARKLSIGENSVVLIDVGNMNTIMPMNPSLLEAYQKIPALKKYSLSEITKYILAANVEIASGKATNKSEEYLKFKKIVMKNRKQIIRNLHVSETWKNHMKMLRDLKKHSGVEIE